MLRKNPVLRQSAKDALKHYWLSHTQEEIRGVDIPVTCGGFSALDFLSQERNAYVSKYSAVHRM